MQRCPKIKRTGLQISNTRMSLFLQLFWKLSSRFNQTFQRGNCQINTLSDSHRTIMKIITNSSGKSGRRVFPAVHSPVKVAAYTSACIFNQGNIAFLQSFQALGVTCGRNSHESVTKEDEIRVTIIAEQRAHAATGEQMMG